MRKTVLYIAISLDGYIADAAGAVDWLTGHSAAAPGVDSYGQFSKTIDTVILGWNTYRQITTELSPENWVYADFTSYVLTHRQQPPAAGIQFTQEPPAELVNRLKQKAGKDIWICGGADVAQQLMRADCIDRYHLAVIPTLLGDGLRLFPTMPQELKLRLIDTFHYNGIIEAIYERRPPKPAQSTI